MKSSSKTTTVASWLLLGFAILFVHNEICTAVTTLEQASEKALSVAAPLVEKDAKGEVVKETPPRWNEALKYLDQAISFKPDCGRYYLYRAGVLLRLYRFDDAVADCNKALSVNTTSDPVHWASLANMTKAEVLISQGREAQKMGNAAAARDKYAVGLGLLNAVTGQLDTREADPFRRLAEAGLANANAASLPLNPDQNLSLSSLSLPYQKIAQAVEMGDRISLVETPNDSVNIENQEAPGLALSYAAKCQWKEALPYLDQSIAFRPQCSRYHLYRASVLLRLARYDEALSECNKALNPELTGDIVDWASWANITKAEALISRSQLEQARGNTGKANDGYTQALYLLDAATPTVRDRAEPELFHRLAEAGLGHAELPVQDKAYLRADRLVNFSSILLPYQHNAEAAESLRKNLIVKPGAVKMVAMGFDRVVADLYWLGFVQYYGDQNVCVKDQYRQAPSYLNLIVKLDPHFIQAYWFASFVLAGDMGRKEEAERILDYGIAQNPDNYTLSYIAGFTQYLYFNNTKRAADYYRRGAKCSNAPPWLGEQAKTLEENINYYWKKGKSWLAVYKHQKEPLVRQKAREMVVIYYSLMYHHATNQTQKETAVRQLATLDEKPLRKELLPAENPDQKN